MVVCNICIRACGEIREANKSAWCYYISNEQKILLDLGKGTPLDFWFCISPEVLALYMQHVPTNLRTVPTRGFYALE